MSENGHGPSITHELDEGNAILEVMRQAVADALLDHKTRRQLRRRLGGWRGRHRPARRDFGSRTGPDEPRRANCPPAVRRRTLKLRARVQTATTPASRPTATLIERHRPDRPRNEVHPCTSSTPPPLLFETSRPGRYTAVLPPTEVPDRPLDGLIPAAHRSATAPPLPELGELDVVRHYTNLSTPEHEHRREFLSARFMHDEVQPQAERATRRLCPGLAAQHPYQDESTLQGLLGHAVRSASDPRRDRGPARRQPPAGRRSSGRVDGACSSPRRYFPRQGRNSHQGSHPRQRARHESGLGATSPGSRPSRSRATRGASSTSTTSGPSSTIRPPSS